MTLQEKMSKEYEEKKIKWLEENGFNESLTTFIYFPADSYDVKDKLKDAGFRFSSFLLWHSATIPEGYNEFVVEVSLNEVAEIGAWGTGSFKANIKNIVKDILDACRPKEESISDWIFEIKEKVVDYPVVLNSIRGMQTRFGWTQLVKFEDENGNILDWWTAVNITAEPGDHVLLSGTVKEHSEYKDLKTTVMTRCKIKEV